MQRPKMQILTGYEIRAPMCSLLKAWSQAGGTIMGVETSKENR